ncbi:MAG: DNA recombination/repair protein RecA [Candidatus Rokubacteria bacterium]|nr:DNA recombination/repair protein RecA [Candidatus Rokubacteria bacterium]
MAIPIESTPPPGWGLQGIESLLDAFPRGRLSEIVGSWSSGSTSLLQALLVRATAAGDLAALVDADGVFDPASAARAGLDLRRLLWVRCGGQITVALRAADLLARCPGFAVVAVDLLPPPARSMGHRGLDHPALVRLERGVSGRDTTLVFRSPRHVAGSVAALVVEVRQQHPCWIGLPRPTRLGGLASEVSVRHTRGPVARQLLPGQSWTITWSPPWNA